MTDPYDPKNPITDSFLTLNTHLKARSAYGFVILVICLNILIAAMMINLSQDDCPEFLDGNPTPTFTATK